MTKLSLVYEMCRLIIEQLVSFNRSKRCLTFNSSIMLDDIDEYEQSEITLFQSQSCTQKSATQK